MDGLVFARQSSADTGCGGLRLGSMGQDVSLPALLSLQILPALLQQPFQLGVGQRYQRRSDAVEVSNHGVSPWPAP